MMPTSATVPPTTTVHVARYYNWQPERLAEHFYMMPIDLAKQLLTWDGQQWGAEIVNNNPLIIRRKNAICNPHRHLDCNPVPSSILAVADSQ